MFKTVISDTSCLIVLSKIGQLDLLNKIFEHIVTTSEVGEEFGENLPDWIRIVDSKDTHKKRLLEVYVDEGEASAIALALESENPLLIVDVFDARQNPKKIMRNK